jgi:transposase
VAISPEQKAAMRRMFYAEHFTINAIVLHFGVHHTTVERALNQDFKRVGRIEQKIQVPITSDFTNIIEQTLQKYPRIKGTNIFKSLKDRGYQGSYTTLLRELKKIRPRYKRAYVIVETISGEEAQVDWAHAGTILIGRAERKLYCFVMTLSWSRASWVQFTLDMTTETLLRCHESAFSYFGGVPRRILYDNMKTVVIDRSGDFVRFNRPFLEFTSWYCFEPRVCDPFQPNQKGRVERFIRTLRDGFLSCTTITDIEEARYQLRLWLNQVNARPWPGNKAKTVNEQWQQEKDHLLSCPAPMIPLGKKEVRSGKTPLITFDLNNYTIDPKFVRQPLVLFYDDHNITIFSGTQEVARHTRCWDRDQTIKNDAHIKETYALASGGQKTAGMRKLLLDEIPQVRQVLEYCQKLDLPLSRIEKTLGRLYSEYGRAMLAEALTEALAREKASPEGITQILIRNASCSNEVRLTEISLPQRKGVCDLVVSTHDLSEYDIL